MPDNLTIKTIDDIYKLLTPSFSTPAKLKDLELFVKSQYMRPIRMHFNYGYLSRVLGLMEALISATNREVGNSLSQEDQQDLLLAGFMHRVCIIQRAVDNAERNSLVAKTLMDQWFYPRSQRVATLCQQMDFIHFPGGESFGPAADLARDAVIGEAILEGIPDVSRYVGRIRRELWYNKQAVIKYMNNLYLNRPADAVFHTAAAKELYNPHITEWYKVLSAYMKTYASGETN